MQLNNKSILQAVLLALVFVSRLVTALPDEMENFTNKTLNGTTGPGLTLESGFRFFGDKESRDLCSTVLRSKGPIPEWYKSIDMKFIESLHARFDNVNATDGRCTYESMTVIEPPFANIDSQKVEMDDLELVLTISNPYFFVAEGRWTDDDMQFYKCTESRFVPRSGAYIAGPDSNHYNATLTNVVARRGICYFDDMLVNGKLHPVSLSVSGGKTSGNSSNAQSSVSPAQAVPEESTLDSIEKATEVFTDYWHLSVVPLDPNLPIPTELKNMWKKGFYIHLKEGGVLGFNADMPSNYIYMSQNTWNRQAQNLTITLDKNSYTFTVPVTGGTSFKTADNETKSFEMIIIAKSENEN